MILDCFHKESRERLDYSVLFDRELEDGEVITAASAIVTPNTLTIIAVKFTEEAVIVWLYGGVDGGEYVVEVEADTNQGRRRQKSFSLHTHGEASVIPHVTADDGLVMIGFLNDYQPSQKLVTQGAQIVRTSGEVVQIKAVNWFGMETSNRSPHGLWADGYKLMIDRMKGFGFNAIRIPFAGNTFTGTPTGIDFNKPGNSVFQSTTPGQPKSALQILDIIIDYAATKGMFIILDYHRKAVSAAGGADGTPIGTGHTEQNWIDNWLVLAARYTQKLNVIGADLYNEPYLLGWNDWATYAEHAGNAIHNLAPHWLIFVEGVETYNGSAYWRGGQLRGVKDRPVTLNVRDRVVYSPHEYGQSVATQPWLKSAANPNVQGYPDNLTSAWSDAWSFIVEQNIAPIWIGEFGGKFGYSGTGVDNQANGLVERQWGEKLVGHIKARGISFAYWSYNPNSTDTGGIMQDNWLTPQAGKLAILQPLLQE